MYILLNTKVKFFMCKKCRTKVYKYPSATEMLATQYKPANNYYKLCSDCANPKP